MSWICKDLKEAVKDHRLCTVQWRILQLIGEKERVIGTFLFKHVMHFDGLLK